MERPSHAEWTRFLELTGHTRSLVMKTRTGASADLYGTTVDEIVYNVPCVSQTLFPQLRMLSIGILSLIPAMYPSSLHSLVVTFDFYPTTPLDEDRSVRNLQNMATRCQTLSALVLRCSITQQQKDPLIERTLRSTLRAPDAFNKLTRIDLPLYYLTDIDLSLLSILPKLIHLGVDTVGSLGRMRLSERRLHALKGLVLGPDSFPSLKEFGCATLQTSTIHSLLHSCPQLRDRIETIWLRLPDPTLYTPSDIYELLDTMASDCKQLSGLTLLLAASVCHPVLPHAPLSWDELQPLLRMALKQICITHTMPLAISDSNIEALAASQPDIIELSLNPLPIFFRPPQVTVGCLAAISRHCRLVQRVELFMNGKEPIALETIGSAQVATNLQGLFVGYSPVPSPLDFVYKRNDAWAKLGSFLQKVLIPRAKIVSYQASSRGEVTWENEVDNHPHLQDVTNILLQNRERWAVLDQVVCGIRCVTESG